MESFVITPKNAAEHEQLTRFLSQSHIPAKILTEEEKEDMGMLLLLSEVDTNETVSEEEIRKILTS